MKLIEDFTIEVALGIIVLASICVILYNYILITARL